MQNWREIWEKRTLDPEAKSTLKALMEADGLDTGFGSAPEQPWRHFVAYVAQTLGITPADSVFEVGCGAGAFLHDLALVGCPVGGTDISTAQIAHIKRAIPEGSWSVEQADQLDTSERYDYVVAMGVFQYFPSAEYASEVLQRMALKARKGIAVLDIPDVAKEVSALAFRKGSMGDEEYKRRYEGLDHLYLDKSWPESILSGLRIKRWSVEDQQIEGYGNSAFRFNLFAWKGNE